MSLLETVLHKAAHSGGRVLFVLRPEGSGVLYMPGARERHDLTLVQVASEIAQILSCSSALSDGNEWPRALVLGGNFVVGKYSVGMGVILLAIYPEGSRNLASMSLEDVALGAGWNDNDEDKQMAKRADVVASGLHDTKNRIFAVEAMLLNLQARLRVLNPNAGECVAELDKAVKGLGGVADEMNDVLSWYRLRHNGGGIVMVPSVVSDLLDDSVQHAREVGVVAGLDLVVDCQVDGAWVLDPSLVGDSLRNMLGNAVRHAIGRVRISAHAEVGAPEHLVLSVEDDGPGFPPPGHARIVERTGSGVGLLVARRIAKLHRRGGREGSLRTGRSEDLGGALVALHLP